MNEPTEAQQPFKHEYVPLKKDDNPVLIFGQYVLFDVDEKSFGIAHPSGECGIFSKDAFEAHVAAFFGLNF